MGFDESVFLHELIKRPETIRTIVKDDYGPTTPTIIAKRKTNVLFRFHLIYEYPLDGARNGMKLFFFIQRKNILSSFKGHVWDLIRFIVRHSRRHRMVSC